MFATSRIEPDVSGCTKSSQSKPLSHAWHIKPIAGVFGSLELRTGTRSSSGGWLLRVMSASALCPTRLAHAVDA
jgi:hypothetical protein